MPKRISARANRLAASKHFVLGAAIATFLVVFSLGELISATLDRAADSKRAVETMAQASTARALVEREVNTVTSLQNGLAGYLTVRHDALLDAEVEEVLKVLKTSAPSLRNIGIAEGYRMRFMYPLAGNEKAIGIDYREVPEQWPAIQQIVARGTPALVGPIHLVQGGTGLIYRAPLNVDGRYWGLISAVIDTDRLLAAVNEAARAEDYRYAIRSQAVMDVESKLVTGDPALFKSADAVVLDLQVPGGIWKLAVEKPRPVESFWQRTSRPVSLFVGILLAALIFVLLRHRGELAHLVRYDALTGLPNRRFLEERHAAVNARFRRGQTSPPCALLFVDLDHFKAVNDHHGHRSGDAVLQTLANRMRRITRSDDIVVRWGGDEFVALVEGIKPEDMDAFVGRLQDIIEEPLQLGDHVVRIGASVGVAPYPPGGAKLEELLRAADVEMYDEKARRKSAEAG